MHENIRTQKTTHPVLLVPFFFFVSFGMCVYVCTIAHMRSHDDEFYSVTCIHDMCAMPCMCGSLPSPNCLPFHMHAWKALVQQQSSSQRLSSYEDELQNKTWRVLVQGSSHMHANPLATHYYSMQNRFLLVLYPAILIGNISSVN